MRRWLGLVAVGLAGCSTVGTIARRNAAADHTCDVSDVRILSEEREGEQVAAYFLEVCGQRRYYRRDEATYGSGAVRFVDRTGAGVASNVRRGYSAR